MCLCLCVYLVCVREHPMYTAHHTVHTLKICRYTSYLSRNIPLYTTVHTIHLSHRIYTGIPEMFPFYYSSHSEYTVYPYMSRNIPIKTTRHPHWIYTTIYPRMFLLHYLSHTTVYIFWYMFRNIFLYTTPTEYRPVHITECSPKLYYALQTELYHYVSWNLIIYPYVTHLRVQYMYRIASRNVRHTKNVPVCIRNCPPYTYHPKYVGVCVPMYQHDIFPIYITCNTFKIDVFGVSRYIVHFLLVT
jgi:hypothetical protein